ncbi:hypothetical protein RI065_10520 [Mycoplasmatota bacterium zrk1]
MRYFKSAIFILIVTLLLSGCSSNRVVGRPLDYNENGYLIGDTSNFNAHIWVEITEETDISHNSLSDVIWEELWRYRLRADIGEVDKSSYPYKAVAKKIRTDYLSRESRAGLVIDINESFILLNEISGGLIAVSVDHDTNFQSGISWNSSSGNLDEVFTVGDLVEYKADNIMESYPAGTTATKIVSINRIIPPQSVLNYFESDNVAFLGLYGTGYGITPLYWNMDEQCGNEISTYEEFDMVCSSFNDYAVIYDNNVLSMNDAFKEEILHPSDFNLVWSINFTVDKSYFEYGDLLFGYEEDGIEINIYNLLNDETRYYMEYGAVGLENDESLTFAIFCISGSNEKRIQGRRIVNGLEKEELLFDSNCDSLIIKLEKDGNGDLNNIGEVITSKDTD